jgi:hypothetical protein
MADGRRAEAFTVVTKKGYCNGVFVDEKIRVFGVFAQHGLKGLMQILINRYKTNKVVFTPLITDGIPLSVRGEIKTCKAGEEGNPYGEDIQYLECEWIPALFTIIPITFYILFSHTHTPLLLN